MPSVEAILDLRATWRAMQARGVYLLFSSLVAVIALVVVLSTAMGWVMRAGDFVEVSPEEVDQVPDRNAWVDAMYERTDVTGKYQMYNAKLAELGSSGLLDPVTAADARRANDTVFDESKDAWTKTSAPAPSARRFNPKVTFTGV